MYIYILFYVTFINIIYIYINILYKLKGTRFFSHGCVTRFSGFDSGFQSVVPSIKNVCIWHLMLWCITHVCNPALTGLYNGCCRHNRGQLSTRHQQMFIDGALWSYLSPFDQNSANYLYIFCIYIYIYIPRVFPHAPWDWNIYPAIWLFDLWGPINVGQYPIRPIPARWVRYMLALHLELPLRWRHWSSSKSFVSKCVFFLHCFLHTEALFCTMFDNVSHVVEVTVGGLVFFWNSRSCCSKEILCSHLFSFIAGFQDPQLPTQLNHQQVPSNMNGNMPTTWLSDLMFSFASLVGCSWLDALSQHQSRTLGVWLVDPVMSTSTYWQRQSAVDTLWYAVSGSLNRW